MIAPPRISAETIRARIEGIQRLYATGLPAELLWGYAATGNIVTEFTRHQLGLILPEWDAAIAEFRRHCPFRRDRDRVMGECVQRLVRWLKVA